MNTKANSTILMFGAWSALIYPILIILGWWIMAGFIPPPKPSATAAEIVSRIQGNTLGIRAGMVVTMFAAMFAIPLCATVTYFLTKIEGFFGPLSVMQVMAAPCMAMITFYPPMWWLIASFRPDRSPDLTLMLNDASWLQWGGGLTTYLPCLFTITIASFIDKSKNPVFPRWFGYVCIWLVLLLLPAECIFFFKSGPFAWNGLISFYLAIAAYALWFPVAFVILRNAVLKLNTPEQVLALDQAPMRV